MNRLTAYADLIVRVGSNVQPGQTLFITALIDHAPLVRELAEAGYRAGARFVDVNYIDMHVRRAFVEHADQADLTHTHPWQLARASSLDGNALIMLAGDPEPKLLADLDQRRVGMTRPVKGLEAQLKSQNARTVNWVIAAYPTAGQAQQVFGEPDVDRLWEAFATAVRLDADDPVEAWRAHTEKLNARCRQLDEYAFDAVHFSGPGTDLTVGLFPGDDGAAAAARRSTAFSTSPTSRPRRYSLRPTGAARRGLSVRRARSRCLARSSKASRCGSKPGRPSK